jgi:nucleotide-binding universal stress UspA family protein
VGNVIIGYDGSEAARRALERSAELVGKGRPVTVVSAIPVLGPTVHGATAVTPEKRAEQARRLNEARSILAKRGVLSREIRGSGDPADVIIDEAKALDADLILVGTHRKNLAKRLLLGSVSTKVVHDAPCDVLVVR